MALKQHFNTHLLLFCFLMLWTPLPDILSDCHQSAAAQVKSTGTAPFSSAVAHLGWHPWTGNGYCRQSGFLLTNKFSHLAFHTYIVQVSASGKLWKLKADCGMQQKSLFYPTEVSFCSWWCFLRKQQTPKKTSILFSSLVTWCSA